MIIILEKKTTHFNWSTWRVWLALVCFGYMKETMFTFPATNSLYFWTFDFRILVFQMSSTFRKLDCYHLGKVQIATDIPATICAYLYLLSKVDHMPSPAHIFVILCFFYLCTPLSISSHCNINIITLLVESVGPAIFCHSMGSTFHPKSTNFAHTDSSIASNSFLIFQTRNRDHSF